MRVVVECVVDDFVFSYSCVVCFGIYLNIFGTTYKRRWRHMSCTLLRIFCASRNLCASIACIRPTFSSVRRSRTVVLVCCGTVYTLYVLRMLPSACLPSVALAWFCGCCRKQSVGNLPTLFSMHSLHWKRSGCFFSCFSRQSVHLVFAANVVLSLSSCSCFRLIKLMLECNVLGNSAICLASPHSLHSKSSGCLPEHVSHTKLARFFASQIRSLLGVLQVPHGGW